MENKTHAPLSGGSGSGSGSGGAGHSAPSISHSQGHLNSHSHTHPQSHSRTTGRLVDEQQEQQQQQQHQQHGAAGAERAPAEAPSKQSPPPPVSRSRGSLSSLHDLLSPGTLMSAADAAAAATATQSDMSGPAALRPIMPHRDAAGGGGTPMYHAQLDTMTGMTSTLPPPSTTPASTGALAVGHPGPKQRQALPRGSSCTNCREKKTRCSGERPSCAQCVAAAKRVRALLSSALHGVGPDGERVDKRGRKRKAVSSEETLQCRYDGPEEAAQGRRAVAPGRDKAASVSMSEGSGGEGGVQAMPAEGYPAASRKPGMGMGAAPEMAVAQPQRQDSLAASAPASGPPSASMTAAHLPPVTHVAGGYADALAPMNLTYPLAQDHALSHHLPRSAPPTAAHPPWSDGSAPYPNFASHDIGYATSSDHDRARSESVPMRPAYGEVAPDAGAEYPAQVSLVDTQTHMHGQAVPTWPAPRASYPGALREHPPEALPAAYPSHPEQWLSPPASQGSAGALPAKTVLPKPQMPTDRFIVQPPLGAWELNVMILPDGDVDVMAGSPLEYALIYHIIPHTPYLSMPLYPPKFLDSLLLPLDRRPHPALLYILFAYAVQAIVTDLPQPPNPAAIPAHTFPVPYPQWQQVIKQQGMRLADLFLERSRRELDTGIRSVDRPYDLVRASIGISRYLYSFGRFVEGWNIPCTRLAVSCGLHRIINPVVAKISPFGPRRLSASYLLTDQGGPSPPTSTISNGPDGKPATWPISAGGGSSSRRESRGALVSPPLGADPQMPTRLRAKAVIIGPPTDVFDLAERLQVFWAIKAMDWAACVGWGWTGSLADADIQSVWPRPYYEYENGTIDANAVHGIWDLMNPQYSGGLPSTDTTQILAYKTLCLLTRATGLFDLPHPPSTLDTTEGDNAVDLPIPHPMTADILRSLGTAIESLKSAMPTEGPLGPADPWWIMAQTNLSCAEMLLFAEEATYRPGMHELAVNAARRMVFLVERLPEEHCTHLDLVVAIDVSLAARFLYLEAARLQRSGCPSEVVNAAEAEAGVLHRALNETIGKRMHMSRLHGMIVQRVREGLPEKEGEYERS